MFRVIGGAVVYGLALYGVVKLLDRPKMAVVIQPKASQDDKEGSEAPPCAGEGPDDGQAATLPGGASSQASATAATV